MSDFCYGCGKYLDGCELQCPECGMLTEKAVQQGYSPYDDKRRQQGVLFLIMGIILMGTAICLMVFR